MRVTIAIVALFVAFCLWASYRTHKMRVCQREFQTLADDSAWRDRQCQFMGNTTTCVDSNAKIIARELERLKKEGCISETK